MNSGCRIITCFLISFFVIGVYNCDGQKFVHPGINQRAADLVYMRQLVQKGEQQYKAAFDRLKILADVSSFNVTPHKRVLRGPYGKPNIGGFFYWIRIKLL